MTQGTCQEPFTPLRDLLDANLASGAEAGASLAVVRDGELVVDLWGGTARAGEPWLEDTIVQVWSVTKPMAALTVLVLVDRGALDLDAPVASYWPAFRRGDVLVRHLLAHTSGYAGWTAPLDVAGLLDLEHSEQLLAEQEPWWEPGTASGYHMIGYGHLLDGLVRAATGKPLAEQYRDLVAGPLGADFHLGVPEEALDRCADLEPPPPGGLDLSLLPEGNLLVPTIANPLLDVGGFCNSAEWRRVSVAGCNGHGNARSIARAQSVVSHGGEVGGVRLLSPATIDRIFEVQADGPDLVLMVPLRWGIGYGLPQPASAPAVPEGRVCWWTGYGGAIVVNDLDRRVTVAYAMNRMENHFTSSPRTDAYVRTAFACLEAVAR
ncbi:serine hydrolase domain-containing protein [Nocardioides lianchengensis]|uniref:CubicO group peptidase, beta-lactamase class C family n=1 Tax=Nocardioides lianchengensis TaxID=1045774 RepID=A0A1G6V948_9ACTN|nr:serine hydrolase domain-containing protein [Nocardioides lianchengensis]NYG11164.1 CubicO group peptidase (beta-lactamase class C family) [Nocardioides lianchengensis]SDD49356.1 CubicO group peptidase, beta-lactamase class C family [Nocardioides lianchengensis]